MNAKAYKKRLINVLNLLEECDTIYEEKEYKLQECNDYYECVLENIPYLEKYHKLATEVSDNFDRLYFDTEELLNSFDKIDILDNKLKKLQREMGDMKESLIPLTIGTFPDQCYDDMSFSEIDGQITKIDEYISNLQGIKETGKKTEKNRKKIIKWIVIIIGGIIILVSKFRFLFIIIGIIILIIYLNSKKR